MMKIVFVFAAAFVSILAQARDIAQLEALSKGANAQVRLNVIDQDGLPVPEAKVFGGFAAGSGFNDYVLVDGCTDSNGVYVAEGRCTDFLRCDVRKEGYYSTEERVYFSQTKAKPSVVDGKWQPYGEVRKVVLKRIKNPLDMTKAECKIHTPPSFGEWYGFDLERRQWVAPHGQGKTADVLIRQSLDAVNSTSDFFAKMEICFTNNPFAGVYKMRKDQFSEMKSVYEADTNAVYETYMTFLRERRPGKAAIDTGLEEDSYLVFRIRAKVDENGRLVSAHYGKIYGPWLFFLSMSASAVFFNPTPNDTNLEDAETARLSRLAYEQKLEFERKRKENHKSLWPF